MDRDIKQVIEKAKPLDDHQRQLDLIRYSRHALHADGLITNEEYWEIMQDHGAVARLGSYDEVRANASAAAVLAVAAERERCAKVAEKYAGKEDDFSRDIAEEIRSGE